MDNRSGDSINELVLAFSLLITQLVGAVGAFPPPAIAVTISAYVYATFTCAPAAIVPVGKRSIMPLTVSIM